MDNSDISSIISKIVQNPEFAEMVNELRSENGAGETTPEEMLGKLPEIMKTVSPMIGGMTGNEGKAPDKENGSPHPVQKKNSGKYDKVRATKLMQALKPYLSPQRADIIEKCVSVMQIGDIVGALGGIDNLSGKE